MVVDTLISMDLETQEQSAKRKSQTDDTQSEEEQDSHGWFTQPATNNRFTPLINLTETETPKWVAKPPPR